MKKSLLALILVLGVTTVAVAQSRLYWLEGHGDKVYQSHIDGTVYNPLTGSAPMSGLAVEPNSGYLYFSQQHLGSGVDGSIWRVPLSGNVSPEKLVAKLGWVDPCLTIDPLEGKIYWASEGPSWKAGKLPLMRANLDGSGVEEWVENSQGCFGAAIHPAGRLIYWSDGDNIKRAHLDGAADEEVVPGLSGGSAGLTIDTVRGKLYWLWRGGGGSSSFAVIHRANLDGTEPEVVYADTYSTAKDLAIDANSGMLYWTWTSDFVLKATGVLAISVDSPLECGSVWGTNKWCPSSMTVIAETEHMPAVLDLFVDPGAVGLGSPLDGAGGVSTSTTLTWGAVHGSKRYDLQVSESPEFRQMVFMKNTPATHLTFVAPDVNRTYYWRVFSNACGIAPHWSQARVFTTGASGPLVANVVSPADGADPVSLPPLLIWAPAPVAAGYRLEVATDPELESPVIDLDGHRQTDYEFADAQPRTTYYWRVAGVDESNRYTFGPTLRFTTGAAAPGAVQLISPANGAAGVSPYVSFVWQAVTEAETYEIQASGTTDFTSIVLLEAGLTEPGTTLVGPMEYATGYFWRVRGINQGGPGPWSEVWGFMVAQGTGTENTSDLPEKVALYAAYPNPVKGLLTVPFDLPQTSYVRIRIYDSLGRLRATLLDNPITAGRHRKSFDLSALTAGLYLVRLDAGPFEAETSIVVMP